MANIKWVKNFGIKAELLTIYAVAKGSKYIRKVYGLPNCHNYKYIDGEEFRPDIYLNRLNKIVIKNPKKWVRLISAKLNFITDNFESFCKEKRNYKSDLDLYKDYKDFVKRYIYFLGVCDMPIFVEEAMSKKILEEFKNRKVVNIEKYFRIFTIYLSNTHILEEEINLLKIAKKLKTSNENFFGNLEEIKKHPLYKAILAHYRKYFWMGLRLLSGEEHSLKYYFERIKENFKTAEERLHKIILTQRKNKILFKKAIQKLKMDKDLLKCAQLLMWIRDKRYVGITRGSFYKRDLFKKIAEKFNTDVNDVFYLLPSETRDILLRRKNIDFNLINSRKRGYALLLTKGRLGKVIVGKELKKLKKEKVPKINELKGFSANSGKVNGVVRVVLDDKNLANFKKGEILVTNMTTPDYILAIKKSLAIVTDIGGITCHAAIISRELNKPCIIGTVYATRILKTGDLVEVDAKRGLVKILKKNNH